MLDSAQVEFIRLNTFYNLNIHEITNHNLPAIYCELEKYLKIYDELSIKPMVDFISKLMVRLQPHINWDVVNMIQLKKTYSRKELD